MVVVTTILAPARDAVPQNEDIYYDKKFSCEGMRIRPGEYKVTREHMMLVTILGSCVAACIRDPILGIGGMNHFLLPESNDNSFNGVADEGTRYGNYAMELLINDMLKMGCKKERFEIKVFGGAHVGNMNVSVGKDNADFILKYMEQEGLKISSHDLGGNRARKIHFFPDTGRVSRFLFQATSQSRVTEQEQQFKKTLEKPHDTGDVELFD